MRMKLFGRIRSEVKSMKAKDLGGDLVLSRRAYGFEIGESRYTISQL